MSFLQLVTLDDKTFEEIILFWRICHRDIFTDMKLTDITTLTSLYPPSSTALPAFLSPSRPSAPLLPSPSYPPPLSSRSFALHF